MNTRLLNLYTENRLEQAGTPVIDKRPVQGEEAVRLDASCYEKSK